MHVVTRERLNEFAAKHPDTESVLEHWYRHMKAWTFASFAELSAVFASADQVGKLTVFNIGGNRVRLVAAIPYKSRLGEPGPAGRSEERIEGAGLRERHAVAVGSVRRPGFRQLVPPSQGNEGSPSVLRLLCANLCRGQGDFCDGARGRGGDGARSREPGTGSQEPGAKSQEPGASPAFVDGRGVLRPGGRPPSSRTTINEQRTTSFPRAESRRRRTQPGARTRLRSKLVRCPKAKRIACRAWAERSQEGPWNIGAWDAAG
jgi:mRNA interferase HigB